jgi:hypothetical protein
MYLCVRGINVPIHGSEQSCVCVLEVSMYQSREVSSHIDTSNTHIHDHSPPWIDTSNTQIHDCSLPWFGTLIPLTHKYMTVHFPEQSCICVLEVSMYQPREVSSHVFVC